MNALMWQELNDNQGEKITGGAGIGSEVSAVILEGKEWTTVTREQLGYEGTYPNLNQGVRGPVYYVPAPDLVILGEIVSQEIVPRAKSEIHPTGGNTWNG